MPQKASTNKRLRRRKVRRDNMYMFKQVADRTGINVRTIAVACREFLQEIRTHLDAGEEVLLADFGAFLLRDFKERYNHNVEKGGITYTPPKQKIKFEPCYQWEKDRLTASASLIPDELPEGVTLSYRASLAKWRHDHPDQPEDDTNRVND